MIASMPHLAPAVDESQITPGFFGAAIVVALTLALIFLIRSMNKQLSRIQAPKEDDLAPAERARRRQVKDPGRPAEKGTGDAAATEDTRTEGR